MSMKRSWVLTAFAVSISVFFCGYTSAWAADGGEEAAETQESHLEDGIYSAQFDTDSSMFHVNEAKEGRGVLTVKDGEMTIHVSLASKSIVNLFPGSAEDAQKEGAVLLMPSTDSVTYSDGWTEEVFGFDIPVPALNEEFDVALLGKKGKWYDHKVSVTDPKAEEEAAGEKTGRTVEELKLEDGNYTAEVSLEGGSGKASVQSPSLIAIQGGNAVAEIIWNSPNYDYMVVGGEKYERLNTEGNSAFEIPVSCFDGQVAVTADTLAMSMPHEIEYTLTFDSTTLKKAEE